MPNVTAGSILIAQSTGTWVNEQNWEITGTVGAGDVPEPYKLYLGAGASSTPNYYVNYYIVLVNQSTGVVYASSLITAYDSTTKVVYFPNVSPSNASPPVGRIWRLMIKMPVLSSFRWQKNGVDIPNETGRVYTVTSADIGSTISFRSVGGSIPQGTAPTTIAKPTLVTSNPSSNNYTVTGPTPSGNFINSSADFTLLGAIRPYYKYTGRSITVVPASKSPTGQKCLYVSAVANYTDRGVYMTIPSPTQNYSTTKDTWGSFPAASICQLIANEAVFGDKFGIGVQAADAAAGSCILNSTYMLTSYAATYSNQPMSVMVRRPTDITVSGPVDIFVLTDPSQPNSRLRSGGIAEIPSQYRTALGGDIIVGQGGFSIHSNLSQGPTCFVFDSANIAPALAKANSGTSVSGNATTMVLASSANNTTNDYYKDCYLAIAGGISSRITAYNASTRTATVADPYLPTTPASYTVIPNVNGKTLLAYGSPFFASNAYGAIWDPDGTASSAVGVAVVNNTKSFLSCTNPAFGSWDYGISIDAAPNERWGGARLYNPYVASNGNADQMSHFWLQNGVGATAQIVVYDTDDLATVASGSASFSSLTPKSIVNLPCPYDTISMGIAMDFDNTDGKLYVMMDLGDPSQFAYPIILVYQCNKWS